MPVSIDFLKVCDVCNAFCCKQRLPPISFKEKDVILNKGNENYFIPLIKHAGLRQCNSPGDDALAHELRISSSWRAFSRSLVSSLSLTVVMAVVKLFPFKFVIFWCSQLAYPRHPHLAARHIADGACTDQFNHSSKVCRRMDLRAHLRRQPTLVL